jgi:hypothetical protein
LKNLQDFITKALNALPRPKSAKKTSPKFDPSGTNRGCRLHTWLGLRILAERAVVDGVSDRVKEDVLDQRYGSLFAIDCTSEERQPEAANGNTSH